MPTRERFLLRKAYGGTSRPDKCLVVKSLDSSLRPVCPSQHWGRGRHRQGESSFVIPGASLLLFAGGDTVLKLSGQSRHDLLAGRFLS
jgi:hypothetical protein